MKDYYVDDLAEETGRLFGYWASNHMDMDTLVTQFMRSPLRERMDKRYARFCTQQWYDMARQFEGNQCDGSYDAILCEWLGSFYTYLQCYTGKSSKALIELYPFKTMYPRSNVLHDLDMDLAVEKVAPK